jgi:hypothetical protein
MDALELGPRRDAELVRQVSARLPVGGERLHPLAGAVKRHHQLGPDAFAIGVPGGHRAEVGDQLGMTPEFQIRVRTFLDSLAVLLDHAVHGTRFRHARRQARQRLVAPQRERLVEQHELLGAARGFGFAQQTAEPQQVHRRVGHREAEPVRQGRDQFGGLQRPAQPADVRLRAFPGIARRLVVPQPLDQLTDCHDLIGSQQQAGQYHLLASRRNV